MKPEVSVISLTTLIGAGQGLFLALFTVHSYSLFDLLPQLDSPAFYAGGSVLALLLLCAGLASSFFHLGHPERAWRTATQWRTSWLSREVIVLPALIAAIALYAVVQRLEWRPVLATLPSGIAIDAAAALGIAATVLCFALYLCTAMIYACLPFLREWHTPLTVINYTLLGGASGFTLATAWSTASAPEVTRFLAAWALIITLLGLAGRVAALLRNARLRPKSSPQTAIGVKHPHIRQMSQGFTAGSFNTRQFFHGRTRGFVRSIRWLFLAAAFVAPAVLLGTGLWSGTTFALQIAFAVQIAGMAMERWHFFAEANHPQNLYYQQVA